MLGRTLIVGDVHGCWEELQELLRAAQIGDGDQVIAVGDIVDRGPDSAKVLEFFRTRPGACAFVVITRGSISLPAGARRGCAQSAPDEASAWGLI